MIFEGSKYICIWSLRVFVLRKSLDLRIIKKCDIIKKIIIWEEIFVHVSCSDIRRLTHGAS